VSISSTYVGGFFHKHNGKLAFTGVWHLANGKFGEIQHSCLAKFISFRVGKSERQFFCQALLFVGNFSLGTKSLVKSTPNVMWYILISN